MHKRVYLFALVFFLLDFISKLIVSSNLTLGESIVVIPSFFDISYQVNTGGAFSLFTGYAFILALIAIVTIIYIHTFLKDIKNNGEKLGFSLLIGGIFGNLIDRLFYGYVIDFLSFDIFGYKFPVFNIADIFICLGVFIILICSLGGKHEDNSK